MKTDTKPPKQSEADLCAAFIAWAQSQGWTAYPETGGWDIVLVSPDGSQLGVEAKLHFNATLLRQAIPERYGDDSGPDYRAILLPKCCREVREVCHFCGLIYFYPGSSTRWRSLDDPHDSAFFPALNPDKWDAWPTSELIEIPDYVPDVRAGASGPTQLTKWKVGALRITAILEATGTVDRADFKKHGIDFRRWVPSRWLDVVDGRYVRGDRLRFDKQHPKVYAEILAETRELLASQQTMERAK